MKTYNCNVYGKCVVCVLLLPSQSIFLMYEVESTKQASKQKNGKRLTRK